jgi:thiol:disulfide interchange protein DsbC
MRLIKTAAAILLSLITIGSFGETAKVAPKKSEEAKEAYIKKTLEPRLGEGGPIQTVTKTPYGGLYEVRTTSGDILYTDSEAKYLFVGRILNTTTFEDYTKARVDEITKVKFSDLPFDSAIKMVKGDGKRVIAVFEDPNCGYCKHLRKTLQGMDNITVYTFMYNILAEDSAVKSKNIWCSPDRAKAWDDWMVNGKAAPPAPANCLSDPNEKIFALGRKLKINGTPSIFFTDGTRIPGAVDEQTLEKKFASLK